MAEGGLAGGFAQISWSVRYESIHLKKRADSTNELAKLSESPLSELFSFSEKDSQLPPQLIKIDGIWQTGTGPCSNVVNIGSGKVNCQ
jgi:hypothetical protein